MKSAGKRPLRSPPVANGWCSCANGIAPLSYQTSMTSGSRRMTPPQAQVRVTSLTDGRCGSKGSGSSAAARSRSSAYEPTASTRSQSPQRHSGRGVPQ